jgi:hypothetical protein
MNKKHDAGLSQVPNNCQALLGDANYAEMHSPSKYPPAEPEALRCEPLKAA